MRDVFRTALCDLVGIEYPVIQSGMGNVAGPDLVAEVSRAGGLGVLAGLNVAPEELRGRIREVRALTDRPFGVNLWLHTELRPPVDPATIPGDQLAAVHVVLDRFRAQLGLPARSARPGAVPDIIEAQIEVVLEERPAVFSVGLGDPGPDLVRRCRAEGIKVVAMAATVEDARAVAASGVDVVVAQGSEAGGHRSTWVKRASPEAASVGVMALVPQIVDAVALPVVAAGGIADGRGLVAALALGAVGVLLGTRFVATRESMAPEFWKKSLLERDGEDTTVTDAFSGLWLRTFRNTYTAEYQASGAPVLPPLLQTRAAQDVIEEARRRADGEYFPMLSGQGVGLVRDLPGAGEVVETIVREARAALAGLPRRVRLA
ncbi:MAG TPA: nitronate monooxygenase [Methylomirabilota bacterium]|jgi:nitronate monooxygenase|nr:nitronate monooxygenase [Methylomirabilota bacterium]